MIRFLYRFFLVVTLLTYLSVFISPATHWIIGFSSFLIPIFLLSNTILIIITIIKKKRQVIYPAIALLAGIPFILVTFTLSKNSNSYDVKVLSYNVRVFNVYEHLNKNFSSSRKMIQWIIDDDSDIKCLQEFYDDKRSELFNTTAKLSKTKNNYHYIKPIFTNSHGHKFGLAIFSIYPIINKGLVVLENDRNNAIYADLLVKNDTLRVYNVHLQSMSIDENNVVNATRLKDTYIDLFYRLKKGMETRAQQVKKLTEHIQNSPYKVILCGDFNDLPYSYSYFKMKRTLKNTFEVAGNGFGVSYNGKIPFLRIDNQFFSKGIQAVDYQTESKVNFSDHYPIKAKYQLEKKE